MQAARRRGQALILEQNEDQHEDLHSVFRLLLQQLCLDTMPENAVICKLLCCSNATAALVHQAFAGKLTVQLCPPLKTNIDRPQLSTWLVNNARLLRHLSLDTFYVDVEEFAAAGLRAAAGLHSMRPAAVDPTGSVDVEPAAQAILESEAAAQGGLLLMQLPGDCNQQQQTPQQAGVSMLPLLELQLAGSLAGTLLPTISACCRQLTQLQLRPSRTDWLPPPDLRQLHSLRDFQIRGGFLCKVPEDTLRIFSSLTQLTKLDVSFLGAEAFAHLPVSLVDVTAACGVSLDDEPPTAQIQVPNLQHLTRLTRLQTGAVHSSQMLPAQLKTLEAYQLKWDMGFLQLQQLQSVSLTALETNPCLAPLTAMTHLTALQLRTSHIKRGMHGEVSMSEVCSQLAKLPLLRLHSSDDVYSAQDVEHLGACTLLTHLQLECARMWGSVGDFAQQLQRLHSLQFLRLDSVRFVPHLRTPEDVDPLVVALKQLCGRRLTWLRLRDVTLSEEQQSGLRGLLGPGFSYQQGQLHADSQLHTDSEASGDYSSGSEDEGSSSDGGEGEPEGAGDKSDGDGSVGGHGDAPV